MDMPSPTVLLSLAAAAVSTTLCFVAGGMLLEATSGVDANGDDVEILWQALGWYFVAKGFFLGPSLAFAGLAYDRTRAVPSAAD